MNEPEKKEITLYDFLINQALMLSEWNKDNIKGRPEQVRLNCETIVKLAETSDKIKRRL